MLENLSFVHESLLQVETRISHRTSDFPRQSDAGTPLYNPRLDRKIARPADLGPLPPQLGLFHGLLRFRFYSSDHLRSPQEKNGTQSLAAVSNLELKSNTRTARTTNDLRVTAGGHFFLAVIVR